MSESPDISGILRERLLDCFRELPKEEREREVDALIAFARERGRQMRKARNAQLGRNDT